MTDKKTLDKKIKSMYKNMYLSKKSINSLKPSIKNGMNNIYSANVTLSRIISNSAVTDDDIDNGVFFVKSNGPTYELFHVVHRHYSTELQNITNFSKFDMNLDLYFNNLIAFYSLYNTDVHLFIETKFYFDKAYNISIMNKLFSPKLADDNIKLTVHFQSGDKFLGKVDILCRFVDGKIKVKKKEFLVNSLKDLANYYNVGDVMDVDFTLPSHEFSEQLFLLKMLTI